MNQKLRLNMMKNNGFTLVELMVALVISSIVTALVYSFFIVQNHAYSVEDNVLEMEQNSRTAINMMRREIRMAGYNALGDALINNLSSFVPSGFIPTYPSTVNLDANPKITLGSGSDPDMITFLSVLTSENNPTTFSTDTAAGATNITLSLNSTETDDQYNVGDILHIGATSEYARVTAINGNVLTIDTNPQVTGNQGLAQAYPVVNGIGYAVAEISVVSYAVFNEANDPSHTYHTSGHPVLKRKVNAGGFQPVAENITDLQISHLGTNEIQLTLSARTAHPDDKFLSNNGYRTIDTNTKIKIRNVNDISTGTSCDPPGAPANLVLDGLNAAYPCKIHMTWDAATTTEQGCDVTGYIVYYDDNQGGYGNRVEVGNVTDYVLDVASLNACTYYVSVSAENAGGIGPKAAETSITDSVAPDQPTGLAAVNVNGVERQVNLSWNANTDCDLNGYWVYRSTSGSDFGMPINTTIIPKEITSYTDTDFDPIDCNLYYYKIAAADFCDNKTDSTVVSAEPTAPAPPTDPAISTVSGTDTISWTISTDDFDVDGSNYVENYKVYIYSNNEQPTTTLLDPGSTTYDYDYDSTGPSTYEVSAVDACGNESEKLSINGVCAQSPVIEIISPVSGETVSGRAVSISGTVTPVEDTADRTIKSIEIQIDEGDWIGIDLWSSPNWSHNWNTTDYDDGEHTITIKASDTVGCYTLESRVLKVDNSSSSTTDKQLSCKLFACKDKGPNEFVYMAVYVYDPNNNDPVSDANVTANINFGSDPGSKIISHVSENDGWYGGGQPSGCGDLQTADGTSWDKTDIATKSSDTHHKITITITVEKNGYESTTCSRTFSE